MTWPAWPAAARPRWHHGVLLAWLAVNALVFGRHGEQSWHFLATGARSLFCEDGVPARLCGLHVYVAHPELQIGPLSLLAAAPAVLLVPGGGSLLVQVGMLLAGWLVLLVIEHAAQTAPSATGAARHRTRLLLVGLVFAPAWADLTSAFGDLDDVLALLFTALAAAAVTRGRAAWAGGLLALAVLSKPWAVAFLPLLLALPAGRRARAWTAAVLPVLGGAALFVVADPGTLHAAAFRIPNAAASSLRVLGVTDATPPWDRPLQFGLGIALGAWAVRLGRWRAVVMIAAAVRLMLDPQVYSYYTASILVGTASWDVQVRRGRIVPLWTWATFAALFACRYLPVAPAVLGGLRLAICLVLILCALFAPGLLGALARGAGPAETRGDPQDAGSGGDRSGCTVTDLRDHQVPQGRGSGAGARRGSA